MKREGDTCASATASRAAAATWPGCYTYTVNADTQAQPVQHCYVACMLSVLITKQLHETQGMLSCVSNHNTPTTSTTSP